MDQAEPADQTLFRDERQRRQDPSLGCRLRLCAGGDPAQGTGTGSQLVPNFTDFKRECFEQMPLVELVAKSASLNEAAAPHNQLVFDMLKPDDNELSGSFARAVAA